MKSKLLKSLTSYAIMMGSVLILPIFFGLEAKADTAGACLSSENEGAALVLSPNVYNKAETENLGIEVPVEEEIDSINLVMVAISSTLNVRAEGNPEAEIVGKIYRDCGGLLLERGEEWSKIESGDLVGWCSNDYLLFDEEAVAMAKDVGTTNAVVKSGATPIYEAAEDSARIVGFAAEKALLEVVYEEGEDWIYVAYDTVEGFVKSEFVQLQFEIDHGETMEAIKERKRKEAEEKKKLIRRNEAIAADDDTLKVLATIIWCEARGESYEGQLAVGSVVMNRVRSGAYPSTVYDVVFASGQFSPVKTGSFQRAYENGSANATAYKAAEEVLNGYTNVGDMTHFRRKGNRDGYIIGNHVFY